MLGKVYLLPSEVDLQPFSPLIFRPHCSNSIAFDVGTSEHITGCKASGFCTRLTFPQTS